MKIRLLLLTLHLLLLIGCARFSGGSRPGDGRGTPAAEGVESPATATPRPTRPAPAGTTILAEGRVVSVQPPLPLSFRTAGRLLDIAVSPGDRVAAGDLIATLDDEALLEAISSAELQVAQAENSLAQAQLSLDDLLDWEADETAIALAEANLAAAKAAYERAQTQDAAAGNSLTSANINLQRAERAVADAQEAYDTAFDPGREWELFMNDPSCLPGQGGPIPCTGVPLRIRMENERAGAERAVTAAAENLTLARANYNLALSSLNDDSALSAQAAVVSAQQALEQAQRGPRETEIAAARLRLEAAELSLQQAQAGLEQARQSLEDAALIAPSAGEVLSVEAAVGALVGGGAPIVTLLDTQHLQFNTSNLSERDLAQVAPGQPAQITLKTFPGQEIGGTVVRIVPQAGGVIGDAATFTVVIDLDETDLILLAGMTGRVEIVREGE